MCAGERDPITRQRSAWTQGRAMPIEGVRNESWTRQAGDGELIALVGRELTGWHMSISHRRHTRKGPVYVRYPRWDEIADARDLLLPVGVTFVMVLPKEGEYVACHKTTFHLHELTVGLAEYAARGDL